MESKGVSVVVVVDLLMLGLGLQHAQAQFGGPCATGQCVSHCISQGHDSTQCYFACGCRDVKIEGVLPGCRLGCSSKCNDTNKVGSSDYMKERCKNVCYSLCAKGIDITTTAVAAA